MKHKEDIGKLINEKLNQVQKSPSDDLWNKINTTLDEKKKKKRGFFIWFTAIGLLTLLSVLYFGTTIFNSNETIDIENEIVNQKSADSNSKDYNSEKQTENNQTIIDNNEDETNKTETKTITEESFSNNNSINNSSEEVVNKQDDILKSSKKIQKTTSNTSKKSNTTDNKVKTVSNNNSVKNQEEEVVNKQDDILISSKNIQKTTSNTSKESKSTDHKVKSVSNNNNSTEKYSKVSNNKTVDSKKNTSEESINSEIISDKNIKDTSSSDPVSEKKLEINKNPETALEKRLSERQNRKDSITKIREERKDSIAELRKPKEENSEKTEEEEKKDSISENENQKMKFNVTLIAAPQYSTVTGSGSMINSKLNGLDTKGAFNFNYGASLNFVGVKRMYSIGVLKTSISYQTLGVPILDPIYENNGGEMVLVYPESILDFGTLDKNASVSNSVLEDFKNNNNTISLTQKIEYIEVPLQYTYFISEKRFGLQVYGGVSGYFLTSNSLIAENNLGETLNIGEANNLSRISLSFNAGAGLYYSISKIFTAELNPMFKFLYKPTTTESTKGSVLLFGIYTGIRMNLFSKK